MKQVIVIFDFDPETDTVTNVKCSVDGTVTKKKTTKSKKTLIESDKIEIIREDNKLVLSPKAAELLQVSPDDRVIIEYAKDQSKKPIPINVSDIAFDKEGQGNKLTKSLTVSCRGNANSLLSEYGDTFSITPWQGHEGLFVLVGNKDRATPDENVEVTEDENPENDLEAIQDAIDDTDYEINNMTFNFN